jgi:3-oxoacyl-[acyl-carrier-protein] synthase II
MEQYVVTGIGIYNGLGGNAQSSWESLLEGNTAIKQLHWPADDPTKFPATHSMLKPKMAATSPLPEGDYPEYFSYGWAHWDKNTRACLLSVDEAVKDSELKSTNVGVVISTFGAGTTTRLEIFAAMNNGNKKISPRKALNIGLDFPAAQIAGIYKVTGPNTAMDSACTTGITSIDHAINMLKADDELDAMIVGGADHMAEPIYMYWFQNLGALNLSDDYTTNCPFDTKRNGFVMGEGAGTIIIEPLSKAKARNAQIYGIIKGVGIVTRFESDTSPDMEGIGAKEAVEKALRKAGILGSKIDFVNAHGTSTPVGDIIEYNTMVSLTPNAVMVSNKGQIGHMMSGAGIVETIYTLQSMRDGMVPGNANLTSPLGKDMILPVCSIPLNIKYAVKNSFGFGGRNASMVLERYER